MTDWIEQATRLRAAGLPAVLVTVAGVRGSAPREVGAKMLVTATDTRGTIGGGELEHQCSRIAADVLRSGGENRLRRFPLGSNCGQCCGGVVDIVFEKLATLEVFEALYSAWREQERCLLVTVLDDDLRPRKALLGADGAWQGDALAQQTTLDTAALLADGSIAQRLDTPGRGQAFLLAEPLATVAFDVAVFGAGHVGSAVVQLLAGLDSRLRWIDSRRDIFPPRLPANVQAIGSDNPAREVSALPPSTFHIVMTHSHALDLEIVAAILRRGDFAWCGLIGSQSKRRRFIKRLRALSLTSAELERLTCPIGIDGVNGKQPQEIAIAVAAQLLRLREQTAAGSQRKPASLSLVRT